MFRPQEEEKGDKDDKNNTVTKLLANIEKDISTNNQGEGGARPATTTTTTTALIRGDYSQPRGGGFRAGAYSVTNGRFQSTRDRNHTDNMDDIDNDVEDGRPSQHPAEEEGAAPAHAQALTREDLKREFENELLSWTVTRHGVTASRRRGWKRKMRIRPKRETSFWPSLRSSW
jgi:hypothetical protein